MTSSNANSAKKFQTEQAEFEMRGHDYGVIHWRSKSAGILLEQIEQTLGISSSQLLDLFHLGSIYDQSGRLSHWEQLISPQDQGTYLRLHTTPRRFPLPLDLEKKIFFDCEDFILLNKPAGLPCHPTVDNQLENILTALQARLKYPLYITHRLDVGTQGLLLLAKSKSFQSQFNTQLKESQVRKIYRTRVNHRAQLQAQLPVGQILRHWMEPSPRAPKKVAAQAVESWSECRLKILSYDPANEDELELELLTGRTHQIRAQLAALGSPLSQDQLYGAPGSGDFFLLSQTLEFKYLDQTRQFTLAAPKNT